MGQIQIAVALLTEGVDRNDMNAEPYKDIVVALLTEGVDRNKGGGVDCLDGTGRPPHGGRG